VVGCCEYGNELPSSIICGGISWLAEELVAFQNDFDPWIQLVKLVSSSTNVCPDLGKL
jgi:hypothetical protein